MSILERTPAGMLSDGDMMRDYQQSRLTIDRLENEKKELQHELRMARQQAGVGNVNLLYIAVYLHRHYRLPMSTYKCQILESGENIINSGLCLMF